MRRETLLYCFENIKKLLELLSKNDKIKESIKNYINRDLKSEISEN